MGLSVLLIHPHDLWYDPWCVRIIEIARALHQKGHKPTVIYFDTGKLPHCRLNLPPGFEFVSLSRSKRAYAKNLSIVRSYARHADVIHVQKCWPNACLPALWAAFIEDKPLHYDWDDLESAMVQSWTSHKIQTSIINRWEDAMLGFADTVSVASQALRELARARGIPDAHLFDTPVGANLESFSPKLDGSGARKALGVAEDSILVIYSGQLRAEAYANLFILAARVVSREMPGVKFAVLGDGEQLPEVRRLAEENGIQSAIRFTGMIPHEEVPSYLAAADIGVATFEDTEAARAKSPLKIAEYLASGLPIVASDVGDVFRMVGPAGLLAPVGDSDSTGQAILHLIEDQDLRNETGRLARERAETIFNWSRTADNLVKAYTKAMSIRDSRS